MRRLWARVRAWWFAYAPVVTWEEHQRQLDKERENGDRVLRSFSCGKGVGSWELYQLVDELERYRRLIAQAALDGNPFAADLLTKTIAQPLTPEADIDMSELARLAERTRFLNWLCSGQFDHGKEIAKEYMKDVETGRV